MTDPFKERVLCCPVCDGDGRLEYEPRDDGWTFWDNCDYCHGDGEITYIHAQDRLHHYKVKKGLIEPW